MFINYRDDALNELCISDPDHAAYLQKVKKNAKLEILFSRCYCNDIGQYSSAARNGSPQ